MERERTSGVDDRVRRIHDRRPQQHSDGIQIVRGARHNIAGPMPLIVGVAQALESCEQVIAQIELNIPRDTNDHPSRQKLKNAFGQRNREQEAGIHQQLVAGYAPMQIIRSPSND